MNAELTGLISPIRPQPAGRRDGPGLLLPALIRGSGLIPALPGSIAEPGVRR